MLIAGSCHILPKCFLFPDCLTSLNVRNVVENRKKEILLAKKRKISMKNTLTKTETARDIKWN